MKRVAIFRASLLPISETFIRDQAAALGTWEPVLVGLWEVPDGLETPKVPREIVATRQRSTEWRFLLALPIPALVDTFRRLGVRLVHAHFGTDALRAWPSVRAAGVPMVVTLHGYDINIRREWWERGHAGWAMRLYPRRLRRMARHPQVRFIAVSEAMRQRAIAYGIPAQKICVSYIGVDTQRFQPAGVPPGERRRRILFVGRMLEKKGPLLMVRAFEKVRERLPDAELAMVGVGPLLEDARALARDLAVPVEWLGARSSVEVRDQIHRARVFCLPSVTASNGDAEGFGLVLLEAQACGVPVVTSALGGATEGLLEGRTGYGVPEGDVDALAAKLLRFLEDDAFANSASAAAARFVAESFDLQAGARRLEQIYESHCAHAHSP
ncbi:glycosyltransferase [Ramlibacter sp. PS3R-8]|uniref:glycosyltransferase n=1 Tax=Ramlibacter sp. PS3R-8 TaxID=3133437 RepID=UPI0030B11981